MKNNKLPSYSSLTILFVLILTFCNPTTIAAQRRPYIGEYRLFYDLLQPVNQSPLPEQTLQRIKFIADQLLTRGKAVVKLGVPEAPKANRRNFSKALKRFESALAQFRSAARNKNDLKLKESYISTYDSFAALTNLLPTVYPLGMPPIVHLKCPLSNVKRGVEVALTVSPRYDEDLLYSWTVQGASVVVSDEWGLMSSDSCEIHLSPPG
jgi:hypothetical protein